MRGDGNVYPRGRIWWIRYPAYRKEQRESSYSTNRDDAVALLAQRLESREEIMGVQVREHPKGSGRWYVFINLFGKRKSKFVGSQYAANRVAAEINKRIDAFIGREEEEAPQLTIISDYTYRIYPPVPPVMVTITRSNRNVPAISGVYFVWKGKSVAYVGKSVCIKNRARFGHHCIKEGDQLSWLEFPEQDLGFAESFYIGICRPTRNNGNGIG